MGASLRSMPLSVCLLLLPAVAAAESITIAWDPNTEPDIAGYTVYYGTSPITGTGSGQYGSRIDVGSTTWTLSSAVVGQTYYFRVQAYNAAGLRSALSSEISETVLASGPGPAPRISLNRTDLNFGALSGTNNTRTGPQEVMVSATRASVSWTASTSAAWLSITPTSGAAGQSFRVAIRNGTYSAGTTRTGTIVVTAPAAENSPLMLPVTFRVYSAAADPIGVIETPLNNATGLVGAIPVTGWAVDAIGIKEVTVWRDPMPGEGTAAPNGKVFIGRATKVDGARPDVDGLYSEPFDYLAGWGYMLLTNMLPNGGNGSFTLHLYADDLEGRTAWLGARTILCDNANARKPFGTIDTPDQGGSVSGTTYTNFGWVLTPAPNMIPTNGSTITVFIDGVPVGRPVYNVPRSDISTLFPGRANSSGPVGYFQFDTTQLANGIHTIAWSVSDNAGNAEGIGSRYFTVSNGAVSSTLTLDRAASVQAAAGGVPETRVAAGAGEHVGSWAAATFASVPVSAVPLYKRTGFDPGASLELVEKDDRGIGRLTATESTRVEIMLGPPAKGAGDAYDGYLVSDGRLYPLPIGAFLDRQSGHFYWQPGAGFVGIYDLLFVGTVEGLSVQIPVQITIAAKD